MWDYVPALAILPARGPSDSKHQCRGEQISPSLSALIVSYRSSWRVLLLFPSLQA